MDLTKEFWENAYKENAPKMLGICRRYIPDMATAQDLVQEAFITAINKSGTYKGRGSFGAWLRKITINTVLMYIRQKKSRIINDGLSPSNEIAQSTEGQQASNIRGIIEQAGFSGMELLEVIDQLPEHHRLVFNLYVIDNYTHAQIGARLNISPGTSKSHLARARKRIQENLYQKALEKGQGREKKKRAVLFFLLPYKSNYIDKLYNSKLKHYSIGLTNRPPFFLNSIKWGNTIIPKPKWSFFTSANTFWVVGAITGLVIVALISIGKKYPEGHTFPAMEQIPEANRDTITQPVDNVRPVPIVGADTPKAGSTSELEKEKPVVVVKKIIQRKTIIIRDTVKVTDSTHAK